MCTIDDLHALPPLAQNVGRAVRHAQYTANDELSAYGIHIVDARVMNLFISLRDNQQQVVIGRGSFHSLP